MTNEQENNTEQARDPSPTFQIPKIIILGFGFALGIGVSPFLGRIGLVAEYNGKSINVRQGLYPSNNLFKYDGKYYHPSKIKELELKKFRMGAESNLNKILDGGQK